MSLSGEIARLQELHTSGALTEEEFARAKEAVLETTPPAPARSGVGRSADQGEGSLGRAANRFVSFQIVMAIVGLVVFLIFFFAFFLPKWSGSSRSPGSLHGMQDPFQQNPGSLPGPNR